MAIIYIIRVHRGCVEFQKVSVCRHTETRRPIVTARPNVGRSGTAAAIAGSSPERAGGIRAVLLELPTTAETSYDVAVGRYSIINALSCSRKARISIQTRNAHSGRRRVVNSLDYHLVGGSGLGSVPHVVEVLCRTRSVIVNSVVPPWEIGF